jgi:hypothetical protein
MVWRNQSVVRFPLVGRWGKGIRTRHDTGKDYGSLIGPVVMRRLSAVGRLREAPAGKRRAS